MEIFKLLGSIVINNSEANEDIDETTSKASVLGEKLKSGLGTAAKIGGAAVAAAATGVAAITKIAVENYAEYEQLVGGVETLFKDSAGKVQEYANNAYKTAGLSANAYMETVTSFSASLLQSLGGDTAKAAEYADLAITDMSDNANKMGTSMESIQNAYQGFAKQNYTMLDNLKLGYGGTKEEMQRLIDDANALREAQGLNADLTIESYADIVDAIHTVQTEMGITGTTAKEASSTISGSIGMVKSAWSNFLTGMSDPSQDFSVLVGNLVDSVVTAANNLVPRLVETLPRLVDGLVSIVQKLSEYIPDIIGDLLPSLLTGAVSLITTLFSQLPDIFVSLISSLYSTLAPAVVTGLQTLIDAVCEKIGLASVDVESVFANIGELFRNLWEVALMVWQTIGEPVWNMIQSCIGTVCDVFAEKMPAIREFVSQCFSDIQVFWENNLKPCFEAIGNFIETVLAPIFQFVFEVLIGGYVETAFQYIKDLWEKTLKPVFTGITDFLTGVFTLNFAQAFSGLVTAIKGIWDGIVTAVKTPINAVINLVNSFIEGLNNIQVPDWVPLVGGKGINIPLIPTLAQGGILEKGQIGLLEGNGAEAVVPLDQNRKWISAVAEDMRRELGGAVGSERTEKILEKLANDLPQMLTNAFSSMKIVLDTGTLVGETVDLFDAALGDKQILSARGG